MSEIEKDFRTLQQEVNAKVAQAVELLKEAKEIATHSRAGTPMGMDDYEDLREIVGEFIAMNNDDGWDSSMKCW